MCVYHLAAQHDSRYHVAMTEVLAPEIFIGLLAGLTAAMLAVLILQLRSQSRVAKLIYPAYEYALQQAEHDANQVLKKAQQQAREIITKAETTARADIAKRQETIEAANETYFKELEQLHVSMHRHLEQVAHAGVTSLTNASEEIAVHTKTQSETLKKFTTSTKSEWQSVVEQTSKALATQAATAEKTMETVLQQTTTALVQAETEQRSALADHMAKLLEEAKAEVEEYTKQRQQLLDAHIADIVAEVTTQVLHTTLDSTEHAKLAREALAAAKQEHLL